MAFMLAIVTDSTCDLGPAQLAQLGVTVVPLRVQMDGRFWLDWEELDPDALYSRMREGVFATTTPPDEQDFLTVYRRLLATHDAVLSLHLSSGISETVAHARAAAERLGVGDRVRVFDSGFATAPLGELVMTAARLAASGASAGDILGTLERLKASMRVEFTVNDLEYLRRGGRLSRVGAFFGNLLGVRPILTFENGRIVADRRVRGRTAMDDMIGKLEDHFGTRPVQVTIAYAGRDRDRIEELRRALEASRLDIRRGRIQLIGAVVGAYTGPGAYGMVAFPADV
ncbi:DegV family protein [Deinococcus pimensis]|uniref:DegV family protein n=1 Tax=Deinococcus pimensis TaxID=309888 RepID=UPI0004BC3F88|nr:DegV family protein [Deinococcus pimensis]